MTKKVKEKVALPIVFFFSERSGSMKPLNGLSYVFPSNKGEPRNRIKQALITGFLIIQKSSAINANKIQEQEGISRYSHH